MKARYIWFCSWREGHGRDFSWCCARSKKGSKTREAAEKYGKAHEERLGHNGTTVYREVFKYGEWRMDERQ